MTERNETQNPDTNPDIVTGYSPESDGTAVSGQPRNEAMTDKPMTQSAAEGEDIVPRLRRAVLASRDDAREAADLIDTLRSTAATLTDQLREAREDADGWKRNSDEVMAGLLVVFEQRDAAEFARDAALAELATLRTPSPDVEGWKPIETAPKDGTKIVLLGRLPDDESDRLRATVTRWHDRWEDAPTFIAGWSFSSPGYSDKFIPVLWRALPDPPKGDE